MLDAGFCDPKRHNPNDYITHVTNASKRLEDSLKAVKQHEDVADTVAQMFESGFCNSKDQTDPNEWIMFAETAIAELKVI
jgi:hypothetical protein